MPLLKELRNEAKAIPRESQIAQAYSHPDKNLKRYADGGSPQRIAANLNVRKVPSPG